MVQQQRFHWKLLSVGLYMFKVIKIAKIAFSKIQGGRSENHVIFRGVSGKMTMHYKGDEGVKNSQKSHHVIYRRALIHGQLEDAIDVIIYYRSFLPKLEFIEACLSLSVGSKYLRDIL